MGVDLLLEKIHGTLLPTQLPRVTWNLGQVRLGVALDVVHVSN